MYNNRKYTIFATPNNTLYDMKCDEFHNLVRLNGWMKLRQSGSHVIYQKENRTYPVPYHKGKEIGKALEKKMRKEMGLQ